MLVDDLKEIYQRESQELGGDATTMDGQDHGTYACPCCGSHTLCHERSWDVCPVCYWEDGPVQYDDPTYRGGANEESLLEARTNVKAFGASAERYRAKVRPPRVDELSPTWPR